MLDVREGSSIPGEGKAELLMEREELRTGTASPVWVGVLLSLGTGGGGWDVESGEAVRDDLLTDSFVLEAVFQGPGLEQSPAPFACRQDGPGFFDAWRVGQGNSWHRGSRCWDSLNIPAAG